jgi:hypothetical protein
MFPLGQNPTKHGIFVHPGRPRDLSNCQGQPNRTSYSIDVHDDSVEQAVYFTGAVHSITFVDVHFTFPTVQTRPCRACDGLIGRFTKWGKYHELPTK